MKKLLAIITFVLVASAPNLYGQNKNYSDYNLIRAAELIEEEEYQQGLDLVKEHLTEYPHDADAYVVSTIAYYAQGEYMTALRDVNKAYEFWNKKCTTEKYKILWWRAVIYEKLLEYDRVLADLDVAYKLAIKANKEDATSILESVANIYYAQDQYDKSDQIYQRLHREDPLSVVPMLGLARNMVVREQYEDVIALADRCLQLDSEHFQAYLLRMRAYDCMGQTDKAIDDAINYFRYAAEPDENVFMPVMKKHISYAIAKVSVEINTKDSIYWRYLRSSLYESVGNYAKALEEYNNIAIDYGESSTINYYRAECYAELGDMQRAIAEITQIIDVYGEDYSLMASRGNYYRLAGEYESAIKDFSQTIRINPLTAYGYYMRGWCYELMGDDKQALDNYNEGIDLDKSIPYIYLMRGELYLKRGERKRANDDFEEVLQKDTVVMVGSCRQYALRCLGRDEEAVEWMEKIVEENPEEPGAYYDLSCLYALMKRSDESLSALRTAFEKGYRSFAHIDNDDDLDYIRNLPEFKSLIDEYKSKSIIFVEESEEAPEDVIATESKVQMTRVYSGVYEVPCTVNGLPLKFIFDTGAATTTISAVEATFMLKNGYLQQSDIKGKEYYSVATGEIHEGTIIRLREIQIGDAILRNVEASVTHTTQAPLLLGQSVMERFGTITIDNTNSMLIIKQ